MSQIKKGAILSYLNIFLTNIIGLVLTPFIIRSLGISEYGLYTLIGAFVGYLSIMDLGLNNTIIRYISKYRAEKDKRGEENFLATTMIIYFVISILILIIGLVLLNKIDIIFNDSLSASELGKAKIMFAILLINLSITLPGGAFTAICNAYEKFIFPRALSIIKYIIRSFLVYVILKHGADSIGLVILDTIVNIIAIVFTMSFTFSKLKIKFRLGKFNKPMIYEIFSYSVWIFLFAIISQLQWRGGQFIIGIKLDTTQVAIYAVGIVLGSYYGSFSSAISNLFLPKATQMTVKKNTPKELTLMMIKIARFALIPLIIIFIAFLVIGNEFINLWVGSAYEKSYTIALIVMIGYTIPLIQTFANSLLEANKLFKFKTLLYLGSISIGTMTGFLVIGKHGVIGVISSIVISWLLAQIIMNIYFAKRLKLHIGLFIKEVSKGLLFVFVLTLTAACLINQFLTIEGWTGFGIKGFAICTIYAIFLFPAITKDEKIQIFNILKK